MNKTTINIFIIEEDENILKTNKRILLRATENYARFITARSLDEALKIIHAKDSFYDLILLNITLPDGSGLELIPELHAVTDAPILLFSACNIPRDIIEGIERGGDKYLELPYEPDEMTTLALALINRERTSEKSKPTISIIRGKLTLDLITKRAYINGIDTGLKKPEFTILSLLVLEENKSINPDKLNKMILNPEDEQEQPTLQKYISIIQTKLETENSGYTIKYTPDEGYSFTKSG